MSGNQTEPSRYDQYSLRDVGAASAEFARRTAEANARFFLPILRPGMRLLDCGCGPGAISVGLATAIAPGQLVGIDLDGEHIEQARRLAEELGVSSARFEIGNVGQIPYADQSFDAVFCHAVLEHLEQTGSSPGRNAPGSQAPRSDRCSHTGS